MNSARRRVVSGLVAAAMALFVLGSAAAATAATADLSVSVSVSPNPASTYTADIANSGPDNATNVSLVFTVPPGVIPISVTPGGPTCAFNMAGTQVNCALGALANGATTSVTIVLHAITIGDKTGTAVVSASESDPNPADNSDSATNTLTEVGISDVAVTLLADNPDPARVGNFLLYTATVTNIQDDSAQNVVVSVPLPSTMFFLGAASERGACTLQGRTVVCPLGVLNPTESPRAFILVVPLVQGFSYATAGVSLTTADPNPNNNSATARTWVNP